VPQSIPLAKPGGRDAPPPRRRYLRITAEPHTGLGRRVDSLIRRIGMNVQNHASRGEADKLHLAFLISPCDDARITEVTNAVARLGRVQRILTLGVSE
jgi:hypothetical protein